MCGGRGSGDGDAVGGLRHSRERNRVLGSIGLVGGGSNGTAEMGTGRLGGRGRAVSGGGVGAEPYVVSQVRVGSTGTYEAKTQQTNRVLSRETARLLQEYMQNNVQIKYGSDNFPGLTVCAKSGTAEVGGGKKPNALFTGFVADEEYPLAFFIVVEEGGFGAETCIPIIGQILRECVLVMDGN